MWDPLGYLTTRKIKISPRRRGGTEKTGEGQQDFAIVLCDRAGLSPIDLLEDGAQAFGFSGVDHFDESYFAFEV
jgi:hypothetical protein